MRSYERQGIDREPEPHFGPGAIGYERRTGEKSHRRLDWEEEVMHRLKAAKETGIEERRAASTPGSIVLDTNIASARQERDRVDQEARNRSEQDQREDRERSEGDERERTERDERDRSDRDRRERSEREQRERDERERTDRERSEMEQRDRAERKSSELEQKKRDAPNARQEPQVQRPHDRAATASRTEPAKPVLEREQTKVLTDDDRRTLMRSWGIHLDERGEAARGGGLAMTREEQREREAKAEESPLARFRRDADRKSTRLNS